MKKYIIILIVMSLIACNESDFKLCGLGITKPYYVTGLKYNGDFYQMQNEILRNYTNVSQPNNGIAKVRFKVNCHGEIGELEYEEYNLKYQKINLNDSIELQLVHSVGLLHDWVAGKSEDNQSVNSHSFLSFRIVDGEITEILPK